MIFLFICISVYFDTTQYFVPAMHIYTLKRLFSVFLFFHPHTYVCRKMQYDISWLFYQEGPNSVPPVRILNILNFMITYNLFFSLKKYWSIRYKIMILRYRLQQWHDIQKLCNFWLYNHIYISNIRKIKITQNARMSK